MTSGRRTKYPEIARRGVPKKHWTTNVGLAAGHPDVFIFVVIYALAWFIFYRATFDWNAVATLGVFIMTLFIQRANRCVRVLKSSGYEVVARWPRLQTSFVTVSAVAVTHNSHVWLSRPGLCLEPAPLKGTGRS
jgi:cell division protein FtsW (lipid II flippase)